MSFHSTLVRLEPGLTSMTNVVLSSFHSTLVRLIHSGTIKTPPSPYTSSNGVPVSIPLWYD